MDRRKDLIEYIKEYREIREQNINTFMTENITEIIPLFQEKLRWIENGGKWYFVHGAGDMAVGQWVKTNKEEEQ